eukprot:gene12491-15703_t
MPLQRSGASLESLFGPRANAAALVNPLGGITEGARRFQNSATNALASFTSAYPGMQCLAEAQQHWESALKDDTQRRLTWTQAKQQRHSWLTERAGMACGAIHMDGFDAPGWPQLPAMGWRSKSDVDVPADCENFSSGYSPAFGPGRFEIHFPPLRSSPVHATSLDASKMALSTESSFTSASPHAQATSPHAPSMETVLDALQHNTQQVLSLVQSSVQRGASNLEGGLQHISYIFSSNTTPALQQGSSSSSQELVPWGKPRGSSQREEEASDSWMAPFEKFLMPQMGGNGWMQLPKEQEVMSIRDPGRQVAIVTTATLPWMTGTSINPLLRAAYLSTDERRKVTLVIPWLSKGDQARVYPDNMRFDTPAQQELYVREWAKKRTGLACNFKITFYPGRYGAEKGSILPVGDITKCIPDGEADVAVLEEPEHLTWYHHGERWSDKFNSVVGVMHTNYIDYVGREEGGASKAAVLRSINQLCCNFHCHKVIKLSDAVQPLPREHTEFVHGVSPAFLQLPREHTECVHGVSPAFLKVGAAMSGLASSAESAAPCASIVMQDHERRRESRLQKLWSRWNKAQPKQESTQQQQQQQQQSEEGVKSSNRFGKGDYWPRWHKAQPKQESTQQQQQQQQPEECVKSSSRFGKGAYFLSKVLWAKGYGELLDCMEEHAKQSGEMVHLDIFGSGPDSKVFINPSLSDVVATTSAEALAMGKFVVCAEHPSNEFFKRYPNCFTYRNSEEFSECLNKALSSEPKPLTPAELHSLSWEAATDRFLDVADITDKIHPLESVANRMLYTAFNHLLGYEQLRRAVGAGSNTRDLPPSVADYEPTLEDVGGFFDNHARAEAQKA